MRSTRCLSHDNDVMRVVGPAPMGGEFVEIVLDEAPLRKAMLRFSVNILLLSLLISGDHRDAGLSRAALPAGAADAAHHRQHDGVPRRPGESGPHHRRRPSASDEIGIAERELAAMQRDLASMLQQKSHLAALGLAVSKINHDLRNLLDLGAAVLRPARAACPTRACSASRRS